MPPDSKPFRGVGVKSDCFLASPETDSGFHSHGLFSQLPLVHLLSSSQDFVAVIFFFPLYFVLVNLFLKKKNPFSVFPVGFGKEQSRMYLFNLSSFQKSTILFLMAAWAFHCMDVL